MCELDFINNDVMRYLLLACAGAAMLVVADTAMHQHTLSTEVTGAAESSPLECLLQRYHQGEFSGRRQIEPVNLLADAHSIQHQNRQLEQHWQQLSQDMLAAVDPEVVQLLKTKHTLEQAKQTFDQHNHAAHSTIDQLLERTQQDLQRHGVDSPLQEMWIMRSYQLHEQRQNQIQQR